MASKTQSRRDEVIVKATIWMKLKPRMGDIINGHTLCLLGNLNNIAFKSSSFSKNQHDKKRD